MKNDDTNKKQVVFFKFVFLLLTLSMTLAGITLFKLLSDESLKISEHIQRLFFSFSLQIAVILLSAEAWLASLNLKNSPKYSIETLTISGLYNACKYVPGKIWGLIIRAALIKSYTKDKIEVKSTFVDQLAMLHSGFFLLLFSFFYNNKIVVLGPLCIGFIFSVFYAERIVKSTHYFVNKVTSEAYAEKLIRFIPNDVHNYSAVVSRFIIIWLTLAFSFGLCLTIVLPELQSSYILILKITVMAYFAGFVAFFLPSGIGAREGTIFVLLAPYGTNAEIISVAILHRVVATVADIVLALPAVPLLSKLINTKQ